MAIAVYLRSAILPPILILLIVRQEGALALLNVTKGSKNGYDVTLFSHLQKGPVDFSTGPKQNRGHKHID
jgi:hypothetical protein